MCQSKAAGGQRCDYADELANVRHKARSKNRNAYHEERERAVDKAVTEWKKENSELVKNHLPEKLPFQVPAKTKPIPASLKALLTDKSSTPITGHDTEQRETETSAMYEEGLAWKETLTREEQSAVTSYSQYGYELINSMLRRRNIANVLRQNPQRKENWKEKTTAQVKKLDTALQKAEQGHGIKKLYRYYRVPDGVTPAEYIDKYFSKGEGFHEKAFTSTTAYPEFIMGHLHEKNGGKKNEQFIVMEILTSQGASMQPSKTSRSGYLQSMEKEYILPRNMKFRIADVRKTQAFDFGSERIDLYGQYDDHKGGFSSWIYNHQKMFKPGDKRRFPVIQMIDEQLITDTVE